MTNRRVTDREPNARILLPLGVGMLLGAAGAVIVAACALAWRYRNEVRG